MSHSSPAFGSRLTATLIICTSSQDAALRYGEMLSNTQDIAQRAIAVLYMYVCMYVHYCTITHLKAGVFAMLSCSMLCLFLLKDSITCT